METICRSCMSEGSQMRNVFDVKNAQEGSCLLLADMLMACTSIQIESDDGLPIHLCCTCETKLHTAFEFKQQCEKTDTKLRQLSNQDSSKHFIKLESIDAILQQDVNNYEIVNEDCINNLQTASKHKSIKQFGSYVCLYCKKVLRTKKGLRCHQRRHTGEELSSCKFCPAKFTRTNHLKRHLLLHSKPPYKPDFKHHLKDNEGQGFQQTDNEEDIEDLNDEDFVLNKNRKKKKIADNEDKNKNKENEREKQVMECEFCDRKFKYKKSFLHHMHMEHGMSDDSDVPLATFVTKLEDSKIEDEESHEILADNVCNQKDIMIDSPSTDDEAISLENEQDDDHSTKAEKCKRYVCHVCNVAFTRANHLTGHMTIHRALLTHKCNKCDKSFATDIDLNKHVQLEHINKPYVCNVCVKSFSRGEQFIRHLRTHNNTVIDEPHKCSICDATFTRSDHLARHTKTHLQQDKRHVCSDCGKAFNRLDNLRTHQRIHSGLKDTSRVHLCVYCGKDFNSSSNMIVHMRRHTGERPYKCSICNKGFPRSHDLKCHERTHSGEKPYLCTLCGKSFNKSNKLLRHSRVHTGERPYVCSICGRAFTQSNDLSLHMRRHTGARPYVCGVCPARFIQSAQLKAHRRSNNHWMDIPPDLKGGHRVEQVTPITNPTPIKFKTHGKDIKLKDELYGDLKTDPQNIIQQVNIMRMNNELAIIPPPYVLDSKLLQPSTNTGFLVFASMLNSTPEATFDSEKYKNEMQNCSVSSVHSDSPSVHSNKIDVVNGTSVSFSPVDSIASYNSTCTEQYTYETYN